MNKIGERVRRVRLSQAMTVKQLALAAGVSVSYIYAIEAGVRGSNVTKLRRIALALGVPLSILLGEGQGD
ncbi:helix-turn-helix domain-containing protein [Alicyclobacillus sp. SO9]|uniref:helix-turn-helix domain-containing protein n=1 Tax=Alicyclobacillus sp. SO9 TaxID=2665646 RepID=UPI0018E85E41|nr:helix-turn-helix domain-containing protein [Alicyclobacillus sp. SO9]QQE78050.1 helix-turn-helix domain-containing protein [Alicyclobacillus sp. SO9]